MQEAKTSKSILTPSDMEMLKEICDKLGCSQVDALSWPSHSKGSVGVFSMERNHLLNSIRKVRRESTKVPFMQVIENVPVILTMLERAHRIGAKLLTDNHDDRFYGDWPRRNPLKATHRRICGSPPPHYQKDKTLKEPDANNGAEEKNPMISKFKEMATKSKDMAAAGAAYKVVRKLLDPHLETYGMFLPDWMKDEKTIAAAVWTAGVMLASSGNHDKIKDLPLIGWILPVVEMAAYGAAANFGAEGVDVAWNLSRKLLQQVNVLFREQGLEVSEHGEIKLLSVSEAAMEERLMDRLRQEMRATDAVPVLAEAG
jgi:hypothetical protein